MNNLLSLIFLADSTLVWGTALENIILAIVLLIIAIFLRKYPAKLLENRFIKRHKHIKTSDLKIKYNFLLPAVICLYVVNVLLNLPDFWLNLINNISYSFILFSLIHLGLLILKLFMRQHLDQEDRSSNKRGAYVFYYRLLQTVSYIALVLAILSIFGINVGSLVAGLGLGGLAISLAAQDTLSNLIAGFILLNDDHINVGDELELADVSGTLVNLGLRSSQIRAYNRSLVNIPNKKIAENIFVNISLSDKRRVMFKLALPLNSNLDHIDSLIKQTEAYLEAQPSIENGTYYFAVDSITEQGIDLLCRFYILDPGYDTMMNEKSKFLAFLWSQMRDLDLAGVSQGLRLEFAGAELLAKTPIEKPEIKD